MDAQDGVDRSIALRRCIGKGNRWFFVFGFEKNDRANVSAKELEALQAIAADLLQLSSTQLDAHVESEALQENCHDCQE